LRSMKRRSPRWTTFRIFMVHAYPTITLRVKRHFTQCRLTERFTGTPALVARCTASVVLVLEAMASIRTPQLTRPRLIYPDVYPFRSKS
jgi:hypothetical protein